MVSALLRFPRQIETKGLTPRKDSAREGQMTHEIAAAGQTGAALVKGAVKRASASTGAGFDFLMKMAARESGFDPNAKANTSSAAGLFQFIEQTWLATVKNYGAKHGLGAAANAISQNASGKFTVADPQARAEILNMRFDAEKASAMAGELANENKRTLETRLGRAASTADLYTAHFLGPSGAVKLLSAAANAPAADLLPQAAAANRNVFYDGQRPKTVGEVVASIAKSMGGATPEPKSAAPQMFAFNASAPEAATVRTVTRDIASAFMTPARIVTANPGLSATALAVLDALDATTMREERDQERNS